MGIANNQLVYENPYSTGVVVANNSLMEWDGSPGEATSLIDLHTEIAASSTPVFYDLTTEIAAHYEFYLDLSTEISAAFNTQFSDLLTEIAAHKTAFFDLTTEVSAVFEAALQDLQTEISAHAGSVLDLTTEISASGYSFLDLTAEISCAITGFQDLFSEVQAGGHSIQYLKTEIAAVWSKYWLQTEIEAYSVARFSYYTEWNPNRFLPVEIEAKKPYSFSFTVNKGLSNVATSPETELLIPGYSWPLRTLFLDYLRIGDSNEYSFELWWARGHTGKNPLKNVKIKAEYINTNFQNGYEVVTCNWLSCKIDDGGYQTVNETPLVLGDMPCDSKLNLTLKVDSRDCSLTRGLVFFRLVFTGDYKESLYGSPIVYRDGSQYFEGDIDDYTSNNFICRLYIVG